ncbi:hypothetical protein [Halobacterium zhouii]
MSTATKLVVGTVGIAALLSVFVLFTLVG